jgi:3-isopropylmalate dehydrogenase
MGGQGGDRVNILILDGDGIGPEIAAVTVDCLETLSRHHGLGLVLTRRDIGFASLAASGTTLPDQVIEAAHAADGIVLGPVSTADYPPREQGGLNPSGELRRRLDLYANIRPSRVRPGLPAPAAAMDLVVVRENTEGFYADRNMVAGSGEFMPTSDVALAVRKITRSGSRRIAETAFRLAAQRRRHVTAVHKANVLRLTDGLFLEEAAAVAKGFPDVALDDLHIDAAVSELVRRPGRFDVLLATNMYGDIISNLTAELSSGLGLAGSLNAGDRHAAAQTAHGSAPDIAGRDLGNPVGLMLSAAMLLDWLADRHQRPDLRQAGTALQAAVEATVATPAARTHDLGGPLGTRAFGRAVIDRLARS